MDDENKYEAAYAHLSKKRIIVLAEDVTKEVASTLCSLLIYYNGISNTEEIKIFIHTSGGDAAALSSIYDIMRMIQAPVSTIGVGKIYSAGAFLLASGTKGRRFMFKNAEVLIHGLQCSFPEVPVSDQIEAQNYYKYLESFNKKILKMLSKHTGQTLAKITADSQRDLYLSAKEAIDYGMIDAIR